MSFKIAKQNLNKPELNVLQGQRIHTLLHLYSALSHFDNLPVLSEDRIFTTGMLQPALRTVMHLLRTNPANKTCDAEQSWVQAAPVSNKNKAQICCSECTSGTGYCEGDAALSHSNYTRVTDRYRVLFRNLILSGPAGMQTSSLQPFAVSCARFHFNHYRSILHTAPFNVN